MTTKKAHVFGSENWSLAKHPALFKDIADWSWAPAERDLLLSPNALEWKAAVETGERASVSSQKKRRHAPSILIFGVGDYESGRLIQKLKQKKCNFAAINWIEFLERGSVHFEVQSRTQSAFIEMDGWSFDLKSVKSVYSGIPQMKLLNSSDEEKILMSRWTAFLKYCTPLIPNARWFPLASGDVTENSQNRVADLVYARSLGLSVPPFVLTNSAAEARAFTKASPHGVVLRDEARVFEWNEKEYSSHVKPLTWKARYGAQIEAAPVLLLRYLPKKFEARSIVVGTDIWTCRIESQASQHTRFDWRHYDFKNMPLERTELPVHLQKRLKKWVRTKNIPMASVDWIVTARNQWVFLEMNRPGAWLFIELLAGLPVSDALVKALSR